MTRWSPTLGAIELHAPEGAPWEFLVAAAIIVLAPMVTERIGVPGLVGFLVGGLLAGPHVLGWLSPDTGGVPALGDLGLLYLMFLAGLELDIRSLRGQQSTTVAFGAATFAIPFAAGWGSGVLLGFETAAALLLGVLWASHTLVAYPIVRRHGLTRSPAVIAAVGATVITDVLALVVLAAVAGSVGGDGSTAQVALQITFGLAVLGGFCLWVLPAAARWFFGGPGRERVARFVFVLGAFLAAAVVAEVVGIEPIVGSFLAGLALNRLIPAEGPLMERIEFLGSALFVPLFLISVGLLVDPAQLVRPGTLALAGALVVVALLSKVLAAGGVAAVARLGLVGGALMAGLSMTRASATLAATFVGFDLGLFDSETVNAVLLVVLVTLIVGTAGTERIARRARPEPKNPERLGTRVVVPLDRLESTPGLLHLAGRIAGPDKGVVMPVRVAARNRGTDLDAHRRFVKEADELAAEAKLDTHAVLRVDSSYDEGVIHTVIADEASLLLLEVRNGRQEHGLLDAEVRDIVSGSPVPVALVRFDSSSDAPIERVVVMLSPPRRDQPTSLAAGRLTLKLADLLVEGGLPAVVVASDQAKAEREAARLDAQVEVDPKGPVHWAASEPRQGDLMLLPFRQGRIGTAGLIDNLSKHPGVSVVSIAEPGAEAWPRTISAANGAFARRRAPLP